MSGHWYETISIDVNVCKLFEMMGIVVNVWELVWNDRHCCECLWIGLKGWKLLWMPGNWFKMMGIVINGWVLVKKDRNCCECLGIGLKWYWNCCECLGIGLKWWKLLWMSVNWLRIIGIVVNVWEWFEMMVIVVNGWKLWCKIKEIRNAIKIL